MKMVFEALESGSPVPSRLWGRRIMRWQRGQYGQEQQEEVQGGGQVFQSH